MCHLHQSHSGLPRILPDFRSLSTPLPDLAVVLPRFHLEDLYYEAGAVENPPPRRARRRGPAPTTSPPHSSIRSDPNDISDAGGNGHNCDIASNASPRCSRWQDRKSECSGYEWSDAGSIRNWSSRSEEKDLSQGSLTH